MAKQNKRLVIPNLSAALDLTRGLREKFDIITETPEDCANLFFKNNAQIALLSPFEYAKKSGYLDLTIFPSASISLTDASKDSIIVLSEGKENIANIGYRKGFVYETYLAKILFAENYKTKPQFKVFERSVKEDIKNFDALLLSGDEGIEQASQNDLGLLPAEEWFLLTGLPYVSYVLVTRTEDLDSGDTDFIRKSLNYNHHSEDDLKGEEGLLSDILGAEDDFDDFDDDEESNYTFEFGDTQKASLEEYFNFLFSYSIIENIPDLNLAE